MLAHSRATARLAAEALAPCKLSSLGKLEGLLHDMGKATVFFRDYLIACAQGAARGRVDSYPHAPVGAIWAYERWFTPDCKERFNIGNITSQIISMAIMGHHAGLSDCLNASYGNHSQYLTAIQGDKAEIHYAEAVDNFLREVISPGELDALFSAARAEVEAFFSASDPALKSLTLSLLARLALGALVDGDRWDTACFGAGVDPFEKSAATPWAELRGRLERAMRQYKADTRINAIRAEISAACEAAGQTCAPGIYRLTVPTGGGKTLACLRFALAQAAGGRSDTCRIFYIAPFNTILEQNAGAMRAKLGDDPCILEHHGDLVFDDGQSEAAVAHAKLTERWTSRIILTSMVQFLNTLFGEPNSMARRLPRLAQSVLIFDEIQALPLKCTVLFECALRFLASSLGCTVVLCTATQPLLCAHDPDMPFAIDKIISAPRLGQELMADVPQLFCDLRRVEFIDETDNERSDEQAARDVLRMLEAGQSVLMVVNTRAVAGDIYRKFAAYLAGKRAICIHLSTNMCAAHRQDAIAELRAALDARRASAAAPTVCCISTQLIEAGVDISFPVVIRSLAGLSGILQTAGRANRSMEYGLGLAYIWKLREENLSGLSEIRDAREDAIGILSAALEAGKSLDAPDVMDAYFQKILREQPDKLFYPIGDDAFIARLLSKNLARRADLKALKADPAGRLALFCSWRTAAKAFRAIDDATISVLTPYKEGKRIILELSGEPNMRRETELLRRAQKYCVNMYESDFRKLSDMGAIYRIAEAGVFALDEAYYKSDVGAVKELQPLPFLKL